MRLTNRILDLAIYLMVVPIMALGVYVMIDSVLVSKSSIVDGQLVKMVEERSAEAFEKLEEDSEYVIAWLKIEGTRINYPLVQGEDNSWFLNRNYKGEFATAGSLFLDYRNSARFNDVFSVIYGHRMGNGEMFSDIHYFSDEAFLRSHPKGYLKMRDRTIGLKLISYAEIMAND